MNQHSLDYSKEFIELTPKLKSYLFRLTANNDDAEDICQDTYVKVVQRIDSFKGESSFKTWVFSIATNLAKDNLRVMKRWAEDGQDCCRERTMQSAELQTKMLWIYETSVHTQYEIREHIDMCFTCIIKTLPLDQHICLILKDIYQFKVDEITVITSLSLGIVKHSLADARKNLTRIFSGRCALINKEGICHQCTELNGIFNPLQKEQEEINRVGLHKLNGKANSEKLLKLRTELVRNIDPLRANGTNLHNYLLSSIASFQE